MVQFMTVQAIQEAILALSREDQMRLEEWLADRWDAEMERDFSEGGRGSALIERVDAEIDAAEFRRLDVDLENR